MSHAPVSRRLLLPAAIAAAALIAGCSGQPTADTLDGDAQTSVAPSATSYPLTVTDFSDTEVTIEARPERVVIAGMWMPTEMMAALDLEAVVVGTVENSIKRGWPEYVADLASVGGSPLSVEAVVELTPDLVVATNIDSDIRAQLESMGIEVLVVSGHIVDQIPDEYRLLGEVFDVAEQAETAASYIEDRWAEVEDALAGLAEEDKPRIYFESAMTTGATNSFKSLARGSGSDVLISLAGGINIAGELNNDGGAPEVGAEWIIEQDPDVIVAYASGSTLGWNADLDAASTFYDEIAGRPGFDQISAIRDGRLLLLPSGIMTDPLSPVGLFVLASYLHPDLVDPDRAVEVHEEMLELFFDTERTGTWTYTR